MARLSLFSDSYLSDAGPGIGQQLVCPHRFYSDGGGGDSWVAQNWGLGGHFRFSSYSSYIFGKHKNLQLSDSYLSGAVHRIGQHRFYCDGGGGESSLASNSKRSPPSSVHQSPRTRATSTNFFPRRVRGGDLVREPGLVGFPGFQRKRMKRRFWGGVKRV